MIKIWEFRSKTLVLEEAGRRSSNIIGDLEENESEKKGDRGEGVFRVEEVSEEKSPAIGSHLCRRAIDAEEDRELALYLNYSRRVEVEKPLPTNMQGALIVL